MIELARPQKKGSNVLRSSGVVPARGSHVTKCFLNKGIRHRLYSFVFGAGRLSNTRTDLGDNLGEYIARQPVGLQPVSAITSR